VAGSNAAAGSGGAADGKVSFNEVYEKVLRVRCGSCHNDAPSFGGLAMFPGGPAVAYGNLVDVPAGHEDTFKCKDSGLLRVKQGDPEQSLIYLKVTAPPCGKMMPSGGLGGVVTAEQVSLLRQWIMDGALP
jgi:hypothetical protein